mmetsp:Transcript_22736/g.49277  ORF Transcript_22736/g.49277 Transcript_22736/m.49277 type:complete len:273 (+) Transcript_22736:4960-5778(+)
MVAIDVFTLRSSWVKPGTFTRMAFSFPPQDSHPICWTWKRWTIDLPPTDAMRGRPGSRPAREAVSPSSWLMARTSVDTPGWGSTGTSINTDADGSSTVTFRTPSTASRTCSTRATSFAALSPAMWRQYSGVTEMVASLHVLINVERLIVPCTSTVRRSKDTMILSTPSMASSRCFSDSSSRSDTVGGSLTRCVPCSCAAAASWCGGVPEGVVRRAAVLPSASMAATKDSKLAVPTTCADSDARSTLALSTPSTACSAFSARPRQPLHVMPPM